MDAENIIRMDIKIIISIKSFIFSLVLRIDLIFIIEVDIITLARLLFRKSFLNLLYLK